MRDYIPIDKENLPEQFEIDLANETFILEFNYNQTYDFFTVDLYDSNMNPIILGEKLVLNIPLWSDSADIRLPAPSLVPMDEAGKEKRITYDNFGETVFLYIDDTPPEGEEDVE
ncbi:hypothetical protein C0971_09990 [Bacillus methanolicus]|uniref:phage baseplate plug family protein n=1 Tax=Bacillus methanolicus TaxID=1471 RepID=UPI00200F14F0|nr:hypothetical protein [Bacillus methanolicus]UQD52303.1 hypothetical protein C0971_09990 [Bacillus methanolicus]